MEVPVKTLTVRPNNNDEELDKTIDSLMQRLEDGNLICKVCGKKELGSNRKRNMVSHIEGNHIEGISYPCNMCEKYFRSRNSLAGHVTKKHLEK